MRGERCAVCGLGPVGQPEHIFKMAILAQWLHSGGPEPNCMRYGYRCANGHRWESTHNIAAEAGAARD